MQENTVEDEPDATPIPEEVYVAIIEKLDDAEQAVFSCTVKELDELEKA